MYIAKDGTEIRKHSIQNKVNNSVQNLNNKNIQNKEKSSPVNRDITGQFILETSASNELCQPVLGSSKESSYFIENELGQSNLEILQSNISFTKNKLNKSFQMCEEGTSFTAKEELDQSLQENTKENDYYAKNVSNRSVVKNEKEIVYMTKSKIQTFPKNKRNYSRAKVDNDDCCASPVKKIGAVSTEVKQHHSVSKEESSVMYNADKNTIKTNIEKKKEYQFHMQPQHTVNGKQGKKQYRCDICAGIYRHAFSLKRHFLRNHINYKYLSDSDIANCSINVNSLKDVYEAPSKEHTGKRIGTPEAIIENEITQVSTSEDMIGLYRCHLCQQLFNVRDDLKTHVTNHPAVSSQKNFSCPDCDMTFTHKQNLVRHSSVHSETKTFKYSLCFKKFRTAEKLQKHETLHKGGKTVVCNYCNGFFALEKSLKKHIMKFHKEHVFPCSQCSRNFLTKVLLEKHERLKHSVKLLDSYNVDQTEGCGEIANNNGTESEGKIVNLTVGDCQTGIQVSCSVCKKQFTSYVNMCRHWRLAHHYVPRGKQGKYKSGRSVFVCHSSDLQNDKKAGGEISEAEFFMTVAEKISENLINFVDGKSSQILNGAKKPTAECKMTIRPKVQWTNYNFPSDFDFSQMKEVSYETEWSKPRSTEPEVLLDESNILKAIGLKQEYGDCEEGSESSYVHNLSEESELLSDEEILMNKSNIPKTETTEPLGKDCIEERTIKYICNTCGERFGSLEVIEDHKLNNHLNVFCTHIEIEGEKEIPPEICYNFCSSVGVLKSSIVPPLTCTENSKLHCTKCQRLFSSVSDLHLHILECGGDKAFINFKPDMKKKYRNKMLRWKKIGKGIQRYLDRFEHASNHHKKHKKIENLKSPMWELRYPKYSSQHTRIGKDDKAEIFSCDGCETKFYYLAAFQRHRRGCPLKIAMEGNSSTAPHTDNKTLSQRHSCLHCGKRFTYLARLKKHMKNNCYRTKEQESVFSVNSTVNTATTENNANKKDASTLGTLPLKCDQVSLEGNVTDVGCERNKKTVELKLEKTCFKIDEEHRDVGLVLLENDSQPEECSVPVVVEKDISETSLIASSPSSLDSISVLPTYNTRKSLRKCRKVYVPEQVKINSRRNKTKKELELSDINLDKPCNSSYLAFPQKSEMSNLSKNLNPSSDEPLAENSHKSQSQKSVSKSLTVNCGISTKVKSDEEFPVVLKSPVLETFTEKFVEDSILSVSQSSEMSDGGFKLETTVESKPLQLKQSSPATPQMSPKFNVPIKSGSSTFVNQMHTCPVCRRTFCYLANFRKHIRDVCPTAREMEESKNENLISLEKKKETEHNSGLSSSTLSVRDQIQNSVLGILRAQSKQQEIMNMSAKEEQKSVASSRFHTFSCNVCHKIFFSFVKLLQHSISHKLSVDAEENGNSLSNKLQDSLLSSLYNSSDKIENVLPDSSITSTSSTSVNKNNKGLMGSVENNVLPVQPVTVTKSCTDRVSQKNVCDIPATAVKSEATEVKTRNNSRCKLRSRPGRRPGLRKKEKPTSRTTKRKCSSHKNGRQKRATTVQETFVLQSLTSKRLRKSTRNK